jgi:CBS domain-containing protein
MGSRYVTRSRRCLKMGMFVTLAAFAGGYVTGAKVGDRPMVNARNAMKDVRAWATSLPGSVRTGLSGGGVSSAAMDARTVREVMSTPVESVKLETPLREAAKKMRRKDIGDVLVLNGTGEVQGIVTDRDLAIRSVAEDRNPSTPVEEIMSPITATLDPTATVSAALNLMRQHDVRRLPVVEGGKPLGVVTLGDLSPSGEAGAALADISTAPANS